VSKIVRRLRRLDCQAHLRAQGIDVTLEEMRKL
jgi:hypothetical protein